MLWLEYFGSGNHITQPLQVSLPWRYVVGSASKAYKVLRARISLLSL